MRVTFAIKQARSQIEFADGTTEHGDVVVFDLEELQAVLEGQRGDAPLP